MSIRSGIWKPVVIVILFVIGVVWAVNVLNTGNPLWFSPVQPSYTPAYIEVYSQGELATLRHGEPDFDRLAEALDEALSAFRSRDLVPIGLSEETLESYRADGVAVFVYYDENLRFNIAARLVGVNTLLLPIEGRHSERNYVFIGRGDAYQAGALQIENRQPLDEALRMMGYLPG